MIPLHGDHDLGDKGADMFQKIKNLLTRRGSEPPFCSAIVPAAGSSQRMGGENKLLMSVGGVPVIARTLLALAGSERISELVVAVREEELLTVAEICKAYEIEKPLKLVTGGESRMASVLAALAECDSRAELIAVHDGARPLVTPEVIDAAIAKAEEVYAAAPAVPVKDTIKVAAQNVVQSTPDRSELFAVQTPQVFDAALLRAALQAAKEAGEPLTDDCAAVERLGKQVYLTAGSYENIKITTPEDLILAEAIWENRG